MNSKERVMSAIKHQSIDRVPFDFWAENATIERIFQKIGHRDFNRLLKTNKKPSRESPCQATKSLEKAEASEIQNLFG